MCILFVIDFDSLILQKSKQPLSAMYPPRVGVINQYIQPEASISLIYYNVMNKIAIRHQFVMIFYYESIDVQFNLIIVPC